MNIDHLSYPMQGLLLFAIFFGCWSFGQMVGGGLALALGDGSMMTGNMSPEFVKIFRWVQILASLLSFALPAIIFSYLITGSLSRYSGFKMPISIFGLLMTILIVYTAFPFISQTLVWNQSISLPGFLEGLESIIRMLEEQMENMTKSFLQMDGPWDLFVNLLMAGVVAGYAEEVLFRGTIQKFFNEWWKKPHLAIFASAFIFSFIHFQFLGFLPRLLIGMLFGYIFWWSQNLWLPVIAHVIHNSTQVIAYYMAQKGYISADIENMESFPVVPMLISTVICIVLCVLFYRWTQSKNSAESYGGQLD